MHDSGSAIDNEKNQRRVLYCDSCLLQNASRDFRLLAGNDAPSIYNFVRTSEPTDNSVDSVARDTRLIRDDGPALADESIEQGGFSNVRAPYNRDQGQ